METPEKDYAIFSSPERSIEQIEAIEATMPKGEFTPPPQDWSKLPRTRRLLREGGTLHLFALGDSIVNDTMRSGWVAKLAKTHPKTDVRATVYVRGGGGCQHYKVERRIAKQVIPRRPDVVLVGGISQQDISSIREVIHQLREGLPEVEIVLMTGAFGTADPRDVDALAKAAHSGTGAYGKALKTLAREEQCAYLDMTTPWAEYIRSTKLHPHLFYRDVVHANEHGEQILSKILLSFFRDNPVAPNVSGGPTPALRLPMIFGDNMVLQAGRDTPVWGWASPGETIEVRIGAFGAETTADREGRWTARFANLRETGEPTTLVVKGAESMLTFRNVLIGDVWVGSGQSNMEWRVAGALQPDKEIAEANYPRIRFFSAPNVRAGQPRSDFLPEPGKRESDKVPGRWIECSPKSVGQFSAVMYFFGREIHRKTGRATGLLEASVSGTHIEGWLPKEALARDPALNDLALNLAHTDRTYRKELPAKLDELDNWIAAVRRAAQDGSGIPAGPKGVTLGADGAVLPRRKLSERLEEFERWVSGARAALREGSAIPETPPELPPYPMSVGGTYLFNGMIAPVVPYGIRGVLWYQGENNGGEGESYYVKLKALIETWRELWGRGELPFYYVQLPQFGKPNTDPAGGDGWAKLREAQRNALAVPQTGMAVTIDVGDPNDIHPRNKQDVGQRLALWALRNQYAQKAITPSGPLYRGMRIEGGEIHIAFDHVGSGLIIGRKTHLQPTEEVKDGKLHGFAIAGAEKQWRWAQAAIAGDSLVVSHPEVRQPLAVRYAYRSFPDRANLYNREGLPASPFRTDDW